jgi:AsmA protein
MVEDRGSSKRKRWILIASAVVVAVLLATLALPFLIDVNRFRPMLESRAGQVVGRSVKHGSLSLSILSGKLVASDVEVADDPAFSKSAFLTAKSVEIGIEIVPLIFSKSLKVTEVIVKQPQVTVLQSPDGAFNFSSIAGGAQNSGGSPASTSPAVLVKKFQLTDGKVTFAHTDSSAATRVYDGFNLEADDFSFSSSFPFTMTMSLPGGGSAAISGNAGPTRLADILSTPFNASVKASAVNIAASGLVDPASGIAGVASVDETVMSDGNTAAVTGTTNITGAKLSPLGTASPTPIAVKHSLEVDLRQQTVKVTQADIGIGKAQFRATGTVQSKGDAINVNLQLSGSDVPVDEIKAMLPSLGLKIPTGSHLQGGSVSAKLAISGPVASPVIAGTLQVSNTTVAGFNLAAHITSMAGFGGAATSAPDMVLTSMALKVRATRDGVQVENITVNSPAIGDATGAGTISAAGALDLKMLAHPTGGVAGALTKMASVGSGSGAVPVSVGGTLENPVIRPDAGAGARSLAGQTAKGVASVPGRAIGGLFGKKKDKKN